MKESEREEFLASKIMCVVYHAYIFERELVFVLFLCKAFCMIMRCLLILGKAAMGLC